MKYTVNTTEGTFHLEGVTDIGTDDRHIMFKGLDGEFLLIASEKTFISAEKVKDGANT